MDHRGEPRFRYRDIHLLYSNDGGLFAGRNRLNGHGFGSLDASLGGGVYYGPPGGVHTFYAYIPPAEYFTKHPEWFSLVSGKRTADQAQLCLTNEALRAVIIEKLTAHIEQARAEAAKARRPEPRDFDISQNDWGGMCECPKCRAIVQHPPHGAIQFRGCRQRCDLDRCWPGACRKGALLHHTPTAK